jgi:hypothetical protein
MILWLLPVLALALLSGCIFSPKKGGGGKPPPPPVYPPPESPRQALQNLLTSYSNRDSTEYRKVFVQNGARDQNGDLLEPYAGFSYDVDTTANVTRPGTFNIDDEIHHIRKLAESPDIIRIIQDFGLSTTWIDYPATGPGGQAWREIVIQKPTLEIDTPTTSYLLPGNEVLTYQFSPDSSAFASTGKIYWSIVRWYENTQ